MAFTGAGVKLVGDDCFIKLAATSTTFTGDGSTPMPVGAYVVTAVAGSSGFPAAALGGTATAAGDILIVKTGDSIIPVATEYAVLLTLTDLCDVSSWKMGFSKEQIDVTTLCDLVKKYRAGKADMEGSISGLHVVGTSDSYNANTGILRQFIDIAYQDGDASFDRFDQQDSIMLGFFYTNDDSNIADESYVVAPIQFFGKGIGGELGSGQSSDYNFRFSDKTITDTASNSVALTPTYYRLGDGS